jgi:VWFA-related protein
MKPIVLTAGLVALLHAAQQPQVFRAVVDAVVVPVSVTDRNKPVPGLTAADFELLDNGVAQQISVTTADATPTDVTFAIDTSGSISPVTLAQIKLDLQTMADLLQPSDRVRVVTFAQNAVDLSGLRPGGATLDFTQMATGGSTSLYDSLITVLMAASAIDRPHLVFAVTDGRENASFSTAGHVVDVARLSSAVLCVALVQPRQAPVNPRSNLLMEHDAPGAAALPSVSGPPGASRSARQALDTSAAVTGGLVYAAEARTPMPELFRRVLDDFRAGYVITYSPAGVARGGTHTITVRTKNPRHVIRARKSYEG